MNFDKSAFRSYYILERSRKVKEESGDANMGMSDIIADFIDQVLAADKGTAELQRSELANRFGCVPSQINYVISTRFSPERGYIVESRRGGGGYIRIRRVQMAPEQLVMHAVNAVGDEIDYRSAEAILSNISQAGVLPQAQCKLMLCAVSDGALRPAPPETRDSLRASILKQLLVNSL